MDLLPQGCVRKRTSSVWLIGRTCVCTLVHFLLEDISLESRVLGFIVDYVVANMILEMSENTLTRYYLLEIN